MEWCNGCKYNILNQQGHSCLEDYLIIKDNKIEIKIDEINLIGEYYKMNNIETIRLYQGNKFFSKIVINGEEYHYRVKEENENIIERIINKIINDKKDFQRIEFDLSEE